MQQRVGQLEAMPRCRLAHLPTPIEAMPNLSDALGGARIFVKRDDCTGLALGGNKIRQLEYYLGAAEAEGADTLLITGAVQSNYVRSTVAAAAKRGMACHVQLEDRVPDPSPVYRVSGNVLLDKLMGATIHHYPHGEDEAGADRRLGEIAEDLRRQGHKPFIVPLSPGHPPIAALGYIDAAREIVDQLSESGQRIDRMFVASGSGNTHAGLLFGLRAIGCDIPVVGVCVRRSADLQVPRLGERCQQIADLLGTDNVVADSDIEVDDAVLAPGYGQMNDHVAEAIRLGARHEAILVDPVYTGRVLASTIAAARSSSPDESLLFIHTGGSPALFAYEPELAALV
ncbi:MAG: D-cysteine desulfhydrase family protein [Hyphomicrobiaceae bacterium]